MAESGGRLRGSVQEEEIAAKLLLLGRPKAVSLELDAGALAKGKREGPMKWGKSKLVHLPRFIKPDDARRLATREELTRASTAATRGHTAAPMLAHKASSGGRSQPMTVGNRISQLLTAPPSKVGTHVRQAETSTLTRHLLSLDSDSTQHSRAHRPARLAAASRSLSPVGGSSPMASSSTPSRSTPSTCEKPRRASLLPVSEPRPISHVSLRTLLEGSRERSSTSGSPGLNALSPGLHALTPSPGFAALSPSAVLGAPSSFPGMSGAPATKWPERSRPVTSAIAVQHWPQSAFSWQSAAPPAPVVRYPNPPSPQMVERLRTSSSLSSSHCMSPASSFSSPMHANNNAAPSPFSERNLPASPLVAARHNPLCNPQLVPIREAGNQPNPLDAFRREAPYFINSDLAINSPTVQQTRDKAAAIWRDGAGSPALGGDLSPRHYFRRPQSSPHNRPWEIKDDWRGDAGRVRERLSPESTSISPRAPDSPMALANDTLGVLSPQRHELRRSTSREASLNLAATVVQEVRVGRRPDTREGERGELMSGWG